MSIHATLGSVVDAGPALRRLADQCLPVRTAYQIAKLAKLVAAETEIYQEKRLEIFKAHGIPRPAATDAERAQYGATVLELPDDARALVAALLQALNDVPVTIAWTPLPLAQLDGLSIQPIDLLALDPFLLVEEDPPGPA